MVEIVIGHRIVDKCTAFASHVCASYAAGRKEASRNLAVPGKPEIDQNEQAQYIGRIAEYAACLYLGGDPNLLLDWGTKCDKGVDFAIAGLTFDVKASGHPAASRLIWPMTKNHFLHAAASVFIFAKVPVEGKDTLGQVVELVGWTSRQNFIENAETSKDLKGMVNGTKFMHRANLLPMPDLLENIKQLSSGVIR